MISEAPNRELPQTVDEVDLDRLVWDPDYRDAVRQLIKRHDSATKSRNENENNSNGGR